MKCTKCNGKGGFQQVISYFRDGEPDVAWDLCPSCLGTGKESEEEKDRLKKELEDEDKFFEMQDKLFGGNSDAKI